ncbi:MAG: ABC transporter substrate-binding protein [Candidatus Synoicihabitans palmerolidicus]|nr:ABC transporter substrate-binding protein [Candidatus Synoicihabitans palmerolidicus]
MHITTFVPSRARRFSRALTIALISMVGIGGTQPAHAQLSPEKNELKFGFIKLTDCAPLVIAKEKGFFRDEGLAVEVIAQPNWNTLLDNVISGNLDGAHMLSGQPIAATIGIGTKAHIVTAFTMDLNGNGITVSNAVWEAMQLEDLELDTPTPAHPISARGLRPVVDEYLSSGAKLQMGMGFPVSTHNYGIRYWLAAAGIHPGMYTATDIGGRTDAEVELSVTPPPMMPTVLEAGNIQGYCVGEPWNQQAVAKGIGVPVTTNYDIWKNNPEKVFGVSKTWADANPDTHIAVVKALIRAGKWLDETDASGTLVNREEAVRILAQPNYVDADYDVIKNSMTGSFIFQKTDVREMPDFNVFSNTTPRIRGIATVFGSSPRCVGGAKSPKPSPPNSMPKPPRKFISPPSISPPPHSSSKRATSNNPMCLGTLMATNRPRPTSSMATPTTPTTLSATSTVSRSGTKTRSSAAVISE